MSIPTHNILINVAVPSPLFRSFDYLPPATDSRAILPGMRVRVPFGRQQLIGIVLEVHTQHGNVEAGKLKAIQEILDEEPALDSAMMTFYVWASDYYHYPVGQALQNALPRYVREGRQLETTRKIGWICLPASETWLEQTLHRSPKQQEVYRIISENQPVSQERIQSLLGSRPATFLQQLKAKDLIASCEMPASISTSVTTRSSPLSLNKDQKCAVETVLEAANRFHCYLLEGVTGSGKTEVYLQLIEKVLRLGQQVLVLVPEISLTPQTLKRFQDRFDTPVVSMHSGLNDSERFSAWLRARNGEAKIIIGTRSAVFMPLSDPGMIIIDEEHDASYKQQDGFRYSARDLGIFRAQQAGIPIILGSATPSLESLQNAINGRYTLLRLALRAGNAQLPAYRVIDLKGTEKTDGLSLPLIESMQQHLQQGQQVLLFLNRRGYAPILQCQTCGWVATCPACELGFTAHRHPPSLRCHHCDISKPWINRCPACNGTELDPIGLGTERIENTVSQLFPDYPVTRIDRDSTRRKHSFEKAMQTVLSGNPGILIGTQMLAKGHHLPDVTLVGIIDADSGLFSANFRGLEIMGQLITQVAGRAGRGDKAGEVLIQSYHSTHPSLALLINSGYPAFARELIRERQETGLPPFSSMALLRAESAAAEPARQFLFAASQLLQQVEGCRILGPMPAPIEKKAGRFRMMLVLQSSRRSSIQRLCRTLIENLETLPVARKVRWALDVDPLDLS